MPSLPTKSESRKIDHAVADIMAIIAFAKREHAAKAKEARKWEVPNGQ